MEMTQRFQARNIFDDLNDAIRGFESSAVNFASAIAPWLSPLTPAYMTFQHSREVLGFEWWIAFVNAAVVELLGLSSVNTGLNFYFYNRRNRAASRQAPLGIVVFSFLFYLLVIVSSNILLDAFAGTDYQWWAVIAVRAGFALQTIPAALIIMARVGHKDMLNELAVEKAENERLRRENETRRAQEQVTVVEERQEPNRPKAGDYKGYVFALLDQYDGNLTLTDITRLVNEGNGVSLSHADVKGTWYKFKSEWTRGRA